MRRVLVISSFVAKGTVGLQATLPALTAGDIEAIAVPTVVLSNHPGFKACAGQLVEPATLEGMIEALQANGWLHGIDGVFTGYLPSAPHVAWAKTAIERLLRLNPTACYIADPVLGDDPGGLYVGQATAEAVRQDLLPLARLITPNRFELAWLAGLPVTSIESAISAARSLAVPMVAATSIPGSPGTLTNVLVTSGATATAATAAMPDAPHGTGDFFAGALLNHLLSGAEPAVALEAATSLTAAVIAASAGSAHLKFMTP